MKAGALYCQYADCCHFCKEKNSGKEVCKICHNPGYLNARIAQDGPEGAMEVEGGDELRFGGCHLLCALLSNKHKIKDFKEFEFVEVENEGDGGVEEIHKCDICHKDMTGGVSCNRPGCRKHAHMRCIMDHRSKFTLKNRDKVLDESEDVSFPGLNYYWSVSYGCFQRTGAEDKRIKIDKSDLMKVDFYNKLINEDRKHPDELKEKLAEEVVAELNQSQSEPRRRKNAQGEVKVGYKAYCSSHKENVASYCLCGIVEERVEEKLEENGGSSVKSIFCDFCGVWYHKHCLSLKPDEHNDDGVAYKCPKCENMEIMFKSPKTLMEKLKNQKIQNQKIFKKRKNFIKERQGHVLKRDNIHFIDYLMTLQSLDTHLIEVKFEDLSYWQKEIPFSLEFLRKRKFESEFIENSVIKNYNKQAKLLFKDIINRHTEGLNSFEQVNLGALYEEHNGLRSDIYLFLTGFQKNQEVYEKFSPLMEVMDKVSEIYQIIRRGPPSFNCIWELYTYMSKGNLLGENAMDHILRKLMVQISDFMEILITKHKIFRHKIAGMDIFNLDWDELLPLETFGSIQVQPGSFLEKMKMIYKESKSEIVKASSCDSLDILERHFKQALESLFFSDFKGIDEVKRYAKYFKKATAWLSKYRLLQEKMEFMQTKIEDENFFTETGFEGKLLTEEEYKELEARLTEKQYAKVIDYKYKQRVRSTLKSTLQEYSSFKEVLEYVIKKGVPVNPHNMEILKVHGLMLRINSESGKMRMITEEELDFFLRHTDDEQGMAISSARHQCKGISKLVKEVRSKGYPSILKKEEKYQKITTTYEEFENFGLRGKAWQRIQTIMSPIQWLDNLIRAYEDHRLISRPITRLEFIDGFRGRYLQKANDEILQEFSIINETKDRKTDTSGFKQFADLRDIYRKMNIKYHNNLIAEFKKRDKYSITKMLKIIRLRYLLELNSIKDSLFDNRCERVSKLVFGISDLADVSNLRLFEFYEEVKKLYNERKKLVDIPKSDKSYIKRCTKWINEVRILKEILKGIETFKNEDVKDGSKYELYTEIFNVINSQRFQELGLIFDSSFKNDLSIFMNKIEEMQHLESDYKYTLNKVDEFRMQMSKLDSRILSEEMLDVLNRLPKRQKVQDLLSKIKDYKHMEDKVKNLLFDLEHLRKLKNHLEEPLAKFQIFKPTEKAGENLTAENLKMFQTYLKSYMSQRLKNHTIIDEEVIDKLRVLHLAHLGITLYIKQGIPLKKLKEKFKKFQNLMSKVKEESNKKHLYDIRVEELVQDKIDRASVLSEKFYETKEIGIDDFFETIESIRMSDVQIISPESGPRKSLEEYFRVLGLLKEAYNSKKNNLADLVTRDEISSVDRFIFPNKLKKWVMDNYSKNSFVKDWAVNLSKCDRANGIEVSCLLEHYKKGDYFKDKTFSLLHEKYKESLELYSQIRIKAKDDFMDHKCLKVEEIVQEMDQIGMQMFNEELKILSEIFINFYRLLVEEKRDLRIPAMKYNEAFEFFSAIETKLQSDQEPFKIFTMGKEIKKEVKEEMMIKTEIGERNKAFSQFLEILSPLVYDLKKYCEVIKNLIMKTIEQSLNIKIKNEKKIEELFKGNLEEDGQAQELELGRLVDFKELVEQIYDFVLSNQSSPLSMINFGSEYLENLDPVEKHIKSSECQKRVAKYINEETANVTEMIKNKVEERIKGYSLESILAKHRNKFQKSKLKSRVRVKKHYPGSNGMPFYKSRKKIKKIDYQKNLRRKIEVVLSSHLGNSLREDLDRLTQRLKNEILDKNNDFNFETLKSSLEKIGKEVKTKIKRALLVQKVISFIQEDTDSEDNSIIKKLMNLDVRTLKNTNFLTKRKQVKRRRKKVFVMRCSKLNFSDFSIMIVDRNDQRTPIGNSTIFLTKISHKILRRVTLPLKKVDIDLKNLAEIPEWLDRTINIELESNPKNVIYGTIEGEVPRFSNKVKFRANSDPELGEVQMLMTSGSYLPEKYLRRMKYQKQNNLNTIFYVVDLSEVKCGSEKLRFDPFEREIETDEQVYVKSRFLSVRETPRVRDKRIGISRGAGVYRGKRGVHTVRVSPKRLEQ